MERQPNVEVELDVFSGRPNPRWMMRSELVPGLSRITAQPQLVAANEPPGLGYRGFIIRNLTGDTQIPAMIRVYGGVITVSVDGRELYFADEQGLERALLEDAVSLGYGDLIAAFSGQQASGDAAAL
jgi:hypothetical protein